MGFVFVSHAAPDKRKHVRPLVQALAIEGLPLWIDRPGSGPNDFQLPPEFVSRFSIQCLRLGQDWDEGIRSALRDAGAVLICLSKAALEQEREVLRQEMWGAQLTRKAVTCIVDDLDLSAMPQERGLLSLGKSQSLHIDSEALELAVDWLLADDSRTPDQLPKAYRLAWQDVRRLRDELRRTMDEAQSASATPSPTSSPSGGRYRWPEPLDFGPFIAQKREAFEGRDWLFDEIAQWQAAGRSRAMLIRADFGVGKSAIMAELVHRNPRSSIIAWHFCQYDTQETLRPGAVVRSLAAQFATTVPGYKEMVDTDPALQERLDRALTDPGSALEFAVLAPLARLPAPPEPRMLLIDALDEALELDTTGPRTAGTIISLLAAKAGRFPPWLRVLVTSRRNEHVTTALSAFGTKEIEAESAANQNDLRHFILARAAREPLAGVLRDQGHGAEPLTQLLVDRSLGKFLYAVRAMLDLESGRIGVADLAALPPGMDSFYLDAFDRRFARAGRDYEIARRVLGVLAVACEPLPAATVAAVLGMSEADVKSVHKTLPDFLRQRAGKLTFDHFSIAEWLTRENDEGFARAGDYAVDVCASQAAMRQWALDQVKQGIGHRSDYLLKHLPDHLSSEDERRRIWGALLSDLDWMQAKMQATDVAALIADYDLLPRDEELRPIQSALRLSAHILGRDPSQLKPQLYGRLHWMEPRLARLESQYAQTGAPWLRLLMPTLASPADPLLQVFDERDAPVKTTMLAVSAGRVVVSGGVDGVRIWELATGTERFSFLSTERTPSGRHESEVTAVGIAPDESRFFACFAVGVVRIWKFATRDLERTIDCSREPRAAAVTPDGCHLIVVSSDGLQVWDLASGNLRYQVERGGDVIAIAPAGTCLIAARETICVWDVDAGIARSEFRCKGEVDALAVAPDGTTVVAGGTSRESPWICSYEVSSGRLLHEFRGHTVDADWYWRGASARIYALAIVSDGLTLLSAGGDKTIRLWNLDTGEMKAVFDHTGAALALAVLPDGHSAVSAGWDHTVRVWRLSAPRVQTRTHRHGGAILALAFSPDGKWLLSGGEDSIVRLWDTDTWEPVSDFKGHARRVRATAFTADSRWALSAGLDDTIRVWEVPNGRLAHTFEGHNYCVRGLAAAPDGHRFVSVAEDARIGVWDLDSKGNAAWFNGDGGELQAVALTPDGRLIVYCDQVGGVHAMALASGEKLLEMRGGGHDGVQSVAVTPDSAQAVWGTLDGTIEVWSLESGQRLNAWPGFDPVLSVAVTPGYSLLTGDEAGTIRIMDLRTGRSIASLTCDSRSVVIAASPDGRTIVGGDASGRLHVLQRECAS